MIKGITKLLMTVRLEEAHTISYIVADANANRSVFAVQWKNDKINSLNSTELRFSTINTHRNVKNVQNALVYGMQCIICELIPIGERERINRWNRLKNIPNLSFNSVCRKSVGRL